MWKKRHHQAGRDIYGPYYSGEQARSPYGYQSTPYEGGFGPTMTSPSYGLFGVGSRPRYTTGGYAPTYGSPLNARANASYNAPYPPAPSRRIYGNGHSFGAAAPVDYYGREW
eukprot:NODE_685_length_672_cov_336.711927_g676_i0.p2 GENE.NODE_685_length_672_cov_336.711927_g676_i0~~NODE_685_length_672_cov_336.711927_g676_i0.p2  ORF type:complete len:112 (-),score=18.52 NODE_685_length_672_cov_336.711927_g676_i0:264-599(-)